MLTTKGFLKEIDLQPFSKIPTMFTIKSKVALITGAACGIGLAQAKVLLRNNLKAAALIDINETNGQKALKEIETEFGQNRAIFIKADVSNKVEFEEAFEIAVKTFHQLDIVINNAGILQEIQWEKCINVNLVGTILGSALAMDKYLPKYKSGSEGVILNTSSIARLHPIESIPVYSATKQGIIGFSKCIGGAVHYKLSNIRVVTICPDGTDTDILKPTSEQIQEPFLSMMNSTATQTVLQSPFELAEHAIKIIENGCSGSVWFVSRNTSTEVIFKDTDGNI